MIDADAQQHQVASRQMLWAGQRLEFDGADVFDWMVNDKGILHGGFTLRVNRNRLPEGEREAFDRHVGVRQWIQWSEH